MSKYTEKAMKYRINPEAMGKAHYNCAQAVVTAFAHDLHYDEDAAFKTAGAFGGGMRIGSVCGAITGSLMVLGLAGIDDAKTVGSFFHKVRGNHSGMIDCSDLLRFNAENGGKKGPHCDSMVCECINYVEEILCEKGVLS